MTLVRIVKATMVKAVKYGTYFKISIGLKATTTKAIEDIFFNCLLLFLHGIAQGKKG